MDKNLLYLKLKEKDLQAFNEFVDEYSEFLLKVIHSVLTKSYQKDFVMECYNDTLLTIWNKIHLFDTSKNFDYWIARIAKNKAIDFIRKLDRNYSHETDIDSFSNKSSTESAENEFITTEKYQDILECVNNLDEPNRSIFIYRFLKEKSIEEISLLIDMKESTIYKRVKTLKEKILINFEKEK